MNSFVDTHTHLFCEEFNADRDAAVERAVAAGVGRLCLPSINRASLAPLLEMCNRHKGVCYPMIGLHPTDVDANYREELQEMEKMLLASERFIAVGEVGLDFYWSEEFRSEQFEAFDAQIVWAKKHSLPLVIHSRNAFKELADVMEKHRSAGLTGVFHCFSGDEAEAEALLSHEGFFLGVGGVLTYKNSTLRGVLASVPLERLVLETDSPYLTPVPHRGKRNESAYIPHIAAALAAVYGCTVERVAQVTTENALRLFPKMAAGE
jgi:TatD DNase family protein